MTSVFPAIRSLRCSTLRVQNFSYPAAPIRPFFSCWLSHRSILRVTFWSTVSLVGKRGGFSLIRKKVKHVCSLQNIDLALHYADQRNSLSLSFISYSASFSVIACLSPKLNLHQDVARNFKKIVFLFLKLPHNSSVFIYLLCVTFYRSYKLCVSITRYLVLTLILTYSCYAFVSSV